MSQTYYIGHTTAENLVQRWMPITYFIREHQDDIHCGDVDRTVDFDWIWAVQFKTEEKQKSIKLKLVQAYHEDEMMTMLVDAPEDGYIKHKKMNYEWSEWWEIDDDELDEASCDTYDENAEWLEKQD